MQQQHLQDTTTATIKALTDKINQLGSGSGGRECGHGRGQAAADSSEIKIEELE